MTGQFRIPRFLMSANTLRVGVVAVVVLLGLGALGSIANTATADVWTAERRADFRAGCAKTVEVAVSRGTQLPEGFAAKYCACNLERVERAFPAYRAGMRATQAADASAGPDAQRAQDIFKACAKEVAAQTASAGQP